MSYTYQINIPLSAVPDTFLTSGSNYGISSEQSYVWFLSATSYQDIIYTNVIDIPELQCDPSTEVIFGIANQYIILGYTANEWNGTSGNLVYFHSDSGGTQAIIDISLIGNITVSYMEFKDIKFIGGIVTVLNGINDRGNSGIIFA